MATNGLLRGAGFSLFGRVVRLRDGRVRSGLRRPGVAEEWHDHGVEDPGPYPRILDTGCDYAAAGSVAV